MKQSRAWHGTPISALRQTQQTGVALQASSLPSGKLQLCSAVQPGWPAVPAPLPAPSMSKAHTSRC